MLTMSLELSSALRTSEDNGILKLKVKETFNDK